MASSKRLPANSATAGRRTKEEAHSWPVPVLSRAELAGAFAQALDLAEGRRPGHAARVCYIALNLAEAKGLGKDEQRAVFYGGLLHDAGAAPASAGPCRELNISEEALFAGRPDKSPQQIAVELAPGHAPAVVELLRDHVAQGVRVARDLGLGEDIQTAIEAHHEHWDGRGYPQALKGEEIPITGRLVAAADVIESVISDEPNPLAARRRIVGTLAAETGAQLDPDLANCAMELVRSDSFWLGLHDEGLRQVLSARYPEDSSEADSPLDVHTFAQVLGDLADAKGQHTDGHSRRTAEVVDLLAGEMRFAEGRRELLSVAAVAHDVGLLGVPARVIAKPDILTLEEMETMRRHPSFAQMVLEALPGMEQPARWAGAHHERPDGKGYPEMLEDETIPIEARLIAVADTYVALTSTRPYRKSLTHEDALQVLLGGAGSQLDRGVVRTLCSLPLGATSSRTARRSRRKR